MENACRAFIFCQDKILLCKQKNPSRNFWTLPGGSLEEGETLTNCLSREIFEEIGIALEIDQMLFIRELIDSSYHRIEFYFLIKEPDDQGIFDKISPCNEVEEVKFFALEDLQSAIVKPDCLPNLIREIMNKSGTFPKYLGNVS